MSKLIDMKTISGLESIQVASRHVDVDVSAASRLMRSRNRAVHVGDVDQFEIDAVARDSLMVITQAWSGLDRRAADLWGDLVEIADRKHLKVDRTPKAEARQRVVLARRRWRVGFYHGARRSSLQAPGSDVCCPGCGNPAFVSVQPAGTTRDEWIAADGRNRPVEALDCLLCGLALFGVRQIRWATTELAVCANRPRARGASSMSMALRLSDSAVPKPHHRIGHAC